jgi:hypothetical protein
MGIIWSKEGIWKLEGLGGDLIEEGAAMYGEGHC